MLTKTESNLNPTINLAIQNDSVVNPLGITNDSVMNPLSITRDTTLNPLGITTDTAVNPLDTTRDTVMNPHGITRDTAVNPLETIRDTAVSPHSITRDTVVNPLGITTDTAVGTPVYPVDNTLTPRDIVSVKTMGVPDNGFNGPSKGSRSNQVGSVRLDDEEFEKFSAIAQDSGMSNYNMVHRVIRNFINNPYNNEVFNSDTIRKEEKARCAEKIKGLIPITTHEKQLRDETEKLVKEMAETNTALKEAVEKLAEIQNSEAYQFVLSNRKTVFQIMKFMDVLKAANPAAITPAEFIKSYRDLQQRLKSVESNFEASLTDKLNKQSKEFERKFVKIVEELCEIHILKPFLPGESIFHNALQKMGLR